MFSINKTIGAASLLLGGCLGALFEAPYLLATGLPPVRGISLSARETMLAATDDGLWELSPQGDKVRLHDGAFRAVGAHVRDLYALDEQGRLLWGPPPAPGAGWSPAVAPIGQGWLDVVTWCDDAVLLAGPSQIFRWTPGEAAATPWGSAIPALRAVTMAAGPDCDAALGVTEQALWRVSAADGAAEPLITGLRGLRAASRDGQGRTWLVSGDPPVLSQLEHGALTPVARFLGDPVDLHFGAPPLLPPENLYLGNAAGSVDYIRLPDP